MTTSCLRICSTKKGATIDFRKEQYRFGKASDDERSELVKDIVGFANAWCNRARNEIDLWRGTFTDRVAPKPLRFVPRILAAGPATPKMIIVISSRGWQFSRTIPA